jgi:hypothetical protein
LLKIGLGLCEFVGNGLGVVGAGPDHDTSPTDELEIQSLRTLQTGRLAGRKDLRLGRGGGVVLDRRFLLRGEFDGQAEGLLPGAKRMD